MDLKVEQKGWQGVWKALGKARATGQSIQLGNYLMRFWSLFVTRWLSLVRLWCLFITKKMPNNAGMPQSSIILVVLVNDSWAMSTIELYGITAMFGIFLETNKHQNLTRLSHPVTNKLQNLTRPSHSVLTGPSLCHSHATAIPRLCLPCHNYVYSPPASPTPSLSRFYHLCFWHQLLVNETI